MDLGQFGVLYVIVSLGTYWREYVNIHETYKTQRHKQKPKPSARVVFGTALIMTLLLYFLNLMLLKWSDIPLMIVAFIFGIFGFDIANAIRRDPALLVEWIPSIGKSLADSIRKNKKELEDKSGKKK